MKKLMNILTMTMLAFVMVSFTSCDDDDYIARTLEGTWKGDMYVSTYWNDRYYDASYTEICFLRDPYTWASGDGYWVGYYDYGYWGGNDYIANYIYWTVNNGNIRVWFKDRYGRIYDDDYVDIYDYRLNDDYFCGSIYDDYGQRRDFSLYHVASPNWNSYRYGYYYYDDYYYSNENGIGMSKAPKAQTNKDMPKRVFRGRNVEQ